MRIDDLAVHFVTGSLGSAFTLAAGAGTVMSCAALYNGMASGDYGAAAVAAGLSGLLSAITAFSGRLAIKSFKLDL